MSNPRIAPVGPPYPESIQASFDVVMPQGMPPLNIFRTVAHNPRVLSRMVRGGLLDRGSVSVADRELVILRTCALCGAEYEWGVHVAGFARKAGFSQAQVSATLATEVDATLWNEAQQALLGMTDELHRDARLSDAAWERLCAHYQPDQVIELIMLAGLYHAVSFVVNGLRIDHEAFAPRFPAGAGERINAG